MPTRVGSSGSSHLVRPREPMIAVVPSRIVILRKVGTSVGKIARNNTTENIVHRIYVPVGNHLTCPMVLT